MRWPETARKGGSARRYWQPGRGLRDAGWRQARLSDALGEAIAEAEAINAIVRAWRRGDPWTLPDDQRRSKMEAALPPALAASAPRRAPPTARCETFSDLIHRYRRSEAFRERRSSTQGSYEDNLHALERWGGDAPLETLTPARFVVLRRGLHGKTPTKARPIEVGHKTESAVAFPEAWKVALAIG